MLDYGACDCKFVKVTVGVFGVGGGGDEGLEDGSLQV